jgi:tetratricopeptide (TPR) repeat protein
MPSIEHLETLSSDELKELLPTFRESDPREAIAILKLISERARQEEDFDGMLHWQGEIYELARGLEDSQNSADALYHQGFALTRLDRDIEATSFYLDAKKIYEELLDSKSMIYCLHALVDNSIFISDKDSRLKFTLEALDLARINDDVYSVGDFALKAAEALEAIGRTPFEDITDESYETAVAYAEEAYENFLNIGEVERIIDALCDITHYLTVLGRYESAFERIREAESRLYDLESGPEGNDRIVGRVYKFKGILQMELGHSSEAIEDYKKSLDHLPVEEGSYDLGVVHWRLADLLNDLRRNDESLEVVEKGMSITRRDNSLMYYRCMLLQVHILYEENREIEALFISRGAMLEYESSADSEIPSHIYFGFIQNAALCLLDLERYEEIIEISKKVNTISDYLIPINRSVRIDYMLALAHVYLQEFAKAGDILDALLNFDELDNSDEDIGCAYILRAITSFNTDKVNAKSDFERGTVILESQKKMDHAKKIIHDFPQLNDL